MGRNYLAHRAGDAINAILAAVGYNFRLLLAWRAVLLHCLNCVSLHVRLISGSGHGSISSVRLPSRLLHGRLTKPQLSAPHTGLPRSVWGLQQLLKRCNQGLPQGFSVVDPNRAAIIAGDVVTYAYRIQLDSALALNSLDYASQMPVKVEWIVRL